MGAAGAFPRPHQDSGTARPAVVEIWRGGGVVLARSDPRHARVRCLVRRLLEQDRRAHQSARSFARPCARDARPRWPHLRALAGYQLRTTKRPLASQDGARRDQRTRADRGDQRLHRRVLKIADARDGARSHAGAVLANGDTAAVRNGAPDDHPRPASDVRYARRTLLCALRRPKSPCDRRSRDWSRQQVRATEDHRRRAPEAVMAADRASRIRLRLEWLCRNDHRFPTPHSPART